MKKLAVKLLQFFFLNLSYYNQAGYKKHSKYFVKRTESLLRTFYSLKYIFRQQSQSGMILIYFFGSKYLILKLS